MESLANPVRIELIGDRLAMVNLSFFKASLQRISIELPVSTVTLFISMLVTQTEITSALSWSGYSTSPASKEI
ncbi:hypothetical protein BHE74_00034338 [Ensete ventricosum]|nr:hypothetical protein BHE74_00034338 [Ensete ventricosum]